MSPSYAAQSEKGLSEVNKSAVSEKFNNHTAFINKSNSMQ